MVYKSTTAVGDFNNCLSVIDRTTRQNITECMSNLNSPINQVSLADIYRTQMPQHIPFSGTYYIHQIVHIQSHKTNLDKFWNISKLQSRI